VSSFSSLGEHKHRYDKGTCLTLSCKVVQVLGEKTSALWRSAVHHSLMGGFFPVGAQVAGAAVEMGLHGGGEGGDVPTMERAS
jgi:hypothetical protein